MIWTKQPIKKEIRALNDAVTTLNSNLGQFTRFNASSISEMQTNLLSSANALENRQTIVVGFYSSISGDALFRSGYVYAGNLYINYKVGSELVFSVSLYGPFGENIDISYQNGTWYYTGTKELNTKLLNYYANIKYNNISYIYFIRNANVVYMYCNAGSWDSDGSNSIVLNGYSSGAVVPTGYRPVGGNAEIKEALSGKRLTVAPDGTIFSNEAFTNVGLRFSGCWITNDALPY